MTTGLIDALTPREREILTLIAEGSSLAEIAQQLNRSLKTVESHRLSLGRKLDVSNRVELTKIAIRAGLISINTQQDDASTLTNTDDQHLAETELAWLEQINSAVEMAVGGEYLRQFCLATSQLPGVRVAAVCTPDPLQTGEINPYLRCVMAGADKGVALDPVRYNARNTPCQEIIETGSALFQRGVLQSYPQDKLLNAFQAEGYIGIQLVDSGGKAIGGLGVISDTPIEDLTPYKCVLEFFGPRVAAELGQHKRVEQLRHEQKRIREELRQREMQLRSALAQGKTEPTPLSQIAARVDHLVGESFLRSLTDAICDECEVRIASICTPIQIEGEPGFYTLAISENGHQTDPMWIKKSESACVLFDKQSLIVSARDTPTRYPHCTIAVEGNFQAYVGARLDLEGEGEFCGGLWILNKEPIQDTTTIEAVLMHYAPRVAAEVDQSIYIQRLNELKQKLESQASLQQTEGISRGAQADDVAGQSAVIHIEQRINNFAGPGFFRGITNALCDTLDVRFAGVCLNESVDDQPGFNAISLSEHGTQVDTLRYKIDGTPCQETVNRSYYCCPTNVTRQFPEDDLLVQLDVDGYAGICLETRASGRIGILWIIDSKPIPSPDTVKRIFQHFAPRLSAELEQFIDLENLRLARERLEREVASKT